MKEHDEPTFDYPCSFCTGAQGSITKVGNPNHIGRHMRGIALAALPSGDDSDSEDSSLISEQSENKPPSER